MAIPVMLVDRPVRSGVFGREPRGASAILRRMKKALLLVTSAVVLSACSSSEGSSIRDRAATTARAAGPTDRCDGSVQSPDTRFIVDACGRVVILRGVNVESSSKGDMQAGAHLPKSSVDRQSALGAWGWNAVRFLVFWGAIEPEPGHYDATYLDGVAKWMDWYEAHGIHVVLDMHQDLYAWKVHGDGAPDWAVDTKGLEVKPIAEGQPWYLQGADPAVQAAYQSFWNPADGDRKLQEHYLGSLRELVKRFKDHPAVIGYDVMNEPGFANGDLAATLAIQPEAARGAFRNRNLTDFTNRAIEAVRSESSDAYVFLEPTSLLNAFPYAGDLIASEIRDPRAGPARLVYAGHLYEPSVHDGNGFPATSTYLADWERFRVPEATQMHAALWIGEWGGAPDQARMDAYVSEVLTMSDRNMVGWSWYSWDPGGWSPVNGDAVTPSANGERLMRVQPRAVAGTPESFGWDPAARVFHLRWQERRDATGDTEIAVPASLFPDGVAVAVDGTAVKRPAWDRATGVLRVAPDRSLDHHELCVAPSADGACS